MGGDNFFVVRVNEVLCGATCGRHFAALRSASNLPHRLRRDMPRNRIVDGELHGADAAVLVEALGI